MTIEYSASLFSLVIAVVWNEALHSTNITDKAIHVWLVMALVLITMQCIGGLY